MKIVENKLKYFAVSAIVIIAGIAAMVLNASNGKGAFNYDVEFTGGTAMSVHIGQEFENSDIEQIVKDVTGQKSPQIQKTGDGTEVSIKIQSVDSETRTEVFNAIKDKYSLTDADLLSSMDISGTVSGEMQQKAIMAVVLACICMLIYISIRFKDLRAGASAILTLLHDCIVVIAFYAILRIPLNNSFIAALLTILGYSINATIVIFDRVRENKGRMTKAKANEVIDSSVKQTLARSINTSVTTLLTIGAVYILGVTSVKQFALPIIIGIISGAYSSICLAGSIWYMLLPANKKK